MGTDPLVPNTNEYFRELCQRILNRECVPFFGSGISIWAKYRGAEEVFRRPKDRSYGLTAQGLADLLNEPMEDQAPALCQPCLKKMLLANGDIQEALERDPALPQLCESCKTAVASWHERSRSQLGPSCERYLWAQQDQSYEKALDALVKKLHILEFNKLEPTVGHICVAQLVREGLIPFIFSTNYDTAFEIAFLRSFGYQVDASEPSHSFKTHRKHLAVIHDQASCTRQKSGEQGSGKILHLYKINGCAAALQRESRQETNPYAPKILLTMTQLQSWRERRWAKDAFRVALRTKNLLFSGFGSDEPQVIHTIHEILDEYSTLIAKRNEEEKEPAEAEEILPPSAPLVHSYLPKALDCQLQVVHNFVSSYYGRFDRAKAESLILTREALIGPDKDKNLSADAFWFWIFRETQSLLVLELLEQASSNRLALGFFPFASYIFGEVHKSWRSHLAPGWLAKQQANDSQEGQTQGMTRLSYCLSLLQSHGRQYAPLNSNRVLAAELLFLTWAAKADLSSCRLFHSCSHHNLLHFRCAPEASQDSGPSASPPQEFLLFGTCRQQFRTSDSEAKTQELPGKPPMVAFCLSSPDRKNRDHRLRIKTGDANQQQALFVWVFSLDDLFQAFKQRTGGSFQELRQTIWEMIEAPSKWAAKLTAKRDGKQQKHGGKSWM